MTKVFNMNDRPFGGSKDELLCVPSEGQKLNAKLGPRYAIGGKNAAPQAMMRAANARLKSELKLPGRKQKY